MSSSTGGINRSTGSSNIAAPLSNYLGDFSDLSEILALPKVAGNYADYKQLEQSDIQYYYDSGDDVWLPRPSDFKGYFESLKALKTELPNPLTTWRASLDSKRSQNFVVYLGEWIDEPLTLDAAYLETYIDREIEGITLPTKSEIIKLRKSLLPAGSSLEEKVISKLNAMNYNKISEVSSLTVEIQDGITVLDNAKSIGFHQTIGLACNSDGTRFLLHRHNQTSYLLTLSEPFNPATLTESISINESVNRGQSQVAWISDDGLSFISGSEYAKNILYKYTGTTAWDYNSFTLDSQFNSDLGTLSGLRFSEDGFSFFTRNNTNQIVKYVMTVPMDITTATLDSQLFISGSSSLGSRGMIMSKDLSKIYTIGPKVIREIELPTKGDFNGAITRTLPIDLSQYRNTNYAIGVMGDNGNNIMVGTYDFAFYNLELLDSNVMDSVILKTN